MKTHDPRAAIELLRNHLATHDVPLCFFLGAGTSCSVKIGNEPLIPAVDALTIKCKSAAATLGTEFAKAWKSIEQECKANHVLANIESILSRVRVKIDALTSNDKLLGLTKEQFKNLEKCIRENIAQQVTPEETKIPENIPHDQFAKWVKSITRKRPVEIFTTNYDILLERSFQRSRVPIFDGFVGAYKPFFCPEYIDQMDSTKHIESADLIPIDWVRLWKIHGSVNWHKDGNSQAIFRGEVSKEGLFILPSQLKYDESRKQPYQSFINRMSHVLAGHNTILIVCGHSFGDQHINDLIFNALDNNIQTHAIALQFDDINEDSKLVKQATHRENLIVMGRNACVFKGTFGKWQLNEPVVKSTFHFMDLLFDSDAELESDKDSLTGLMRVGDFARFTKALAEMAGDTIHAPKSGEVK